MLNDERNGHHLVTTTTSAPDRPRILNWTRTAQHQYSRDRWEGAQGEGYYAVTTIARLKSAGKSYTRKLQIISTDKAHDCAFSPRLPYVALIRQLTGQHTHTKINSSAPPVRVICPSKGGGRRPQKLDENRQKREKKTWNYSRWEKRIWNTGPLKKSVACRASLPRKAVEEKYGGFSRSIESSCSMRKTRQDSISFFLL